ncbi:MAG: sulfotransferase [Acidobacteria bacterium]|nr:sulfotransferase [Acidobacteriota bacterium]
MDAPTVDVATRERAPLLIMGSPRSGTTFLSHMVNRFFDIHVSRDNGTLLRFHRVLASYEPLSNDANLRRLIDSLYQDHFFKSRLRERGLTLTEGELAGRVSTRSYGGVIEAVFSAIAETHGKSCWGYKRASFARFEGRHLNDLFPTARFVHIIRDARDVVLSMRNTPKVLLERSWHFAAEDWVSHVRTGQSIGAQLGPERYMEVRYETFMANPAAVLADILAFSGPDAYAAERVARMRTELAGLVRSNNTEKWRKLMSPGALRLVERVAGPLLLDLGYPVVNRDAAGAPVSTMELAWLQADRTARNLFTRNIPMMLRYRFEVLKAHGRARFARGGS